MSTFVSHRHFELAPNLKCRCGAEGAGGAACPRVAVQAGPIRPARAELLKVAVNVARDLMKLMMTLRQLGKELPQAGSS